MATYLGIDVREDAVLLAVVRTAYRKIALTHLVMVPMIEGSAPADTIRDAVTKAFGQVSAGDGVAVAVSGSKTTIRTLTLPASAQKQLAEVIPFELEAQLPYELSDSVFDYKTLSGLAVSKDTIPVTVAVAKVDDVRAPIDAVRAAIGAEPERVGVGAYPIGNVAEYFPDTGSPVGTVAVLDMGLHFSELIVLTGADVVFSRTLSFGTAGLPETAAKLAREVRRTLTSHRSNNGTAPERVWLTGPGAYVSGAEAFLTNELQIPVAVLGSLSIDAEEQAKDQTPEFARFIRAIGLAVSLATKESGYNLRKGPLAFERGFDWLKERVPLLAGFGIATLVCFIFSLLVQFVATSKDRSAYEGALAKVTKDVLGKEIHESGEATDTLAKQVGTPDEDPLPHADSFDVMVKLSDAIPESMKHDVEELDVQKGHVTLHGIVGSIADVEQIVKNLQSERCFADVKRGRMNQQPGSDRQKYVLEFDIKCPEDVKGVKKKEKDSAQSAASASGAKL